MLSRLAAARAASSSTATTTTVPTVLPMDVVKDYLESHVMVRNMHVSVRDVHLALVALHDRSREPQQPEAPPPSPLDEEEEEDLWADFAAAKAEEGVSPHGFPPHGCPQCGVVQETLDAREGHRVCGRCGVVLTLRAINVEPEYMAPPVLPRSRFRVRGVKGVPEYMLAKGAPCIADPRQQRSPQWEELQHWNQFVHLGEDDVRSADAKLKAWRGDHAVEARIAAVLLYPRLQAQFPSTEDVRQKLRSRAPLEIVQDPTPKPTYACKECGEMCHTGRDARLHCWMSDTWGRKRKRL